MSKSFHSFAILQFGPLAGQFFAIWGKVILWKWSHRLWDHFTVLVKQCVLHCNYQSDLCFLGCTPFLLVHVWSSDMIIIHDHHVCSSYISIIFHHQILSSWFIIKVYHHGLLLDLIILFYHHRLSSSGASFLTWTGQPAGSKLNLRTSYRFEVAGPLWNSNI